MQQDEWWKFVEARQWIATRKGIPRGFADFRAGELGQLEITLHRVFVSIDLCYSMIKKTRAFAAIAQSIDLLRAADLCDKRAAE